MQCLVFSVRRLLRLVVHEVVGVGLERGSGEGGRGPQVGGQEPVRLGDGVEARLHEVAQGARVTGGGRVAIVEARHGQDLLGGRRRHEAGTTGRRHQAHAHAAALARELVGHSVGGAGHLPPVAAANRHDVHLGVDDAAADGGGHLLGALHAHAHVALAVAHHHGAAEAGALTSRGLLLHRHDLHHFVLARLAQKLVYNLVLLDRHGEEEDFLEGAHLAVLHKAAELGARHPLAVVTAARVALALTLTLAFALAAFAITLALAALAVALATAEAAAVCWRCI